MKTKAPPLIIEKFQELSNLHLLSVIEHVSEEFTCIIDDITNTEVKAIVLDNKIYQQEISTNEIISQAIQWFYENSESYQFSTYLAKKQISHLITPLYKSFKIGNITRIVGVPFKYTEMTKSKIKRKRVNPIYEGIEIHLKRL